MSHIHGCSCLLRASIAAKEDRQPVLGQSQRAVAGAVRGWQLNVSLQWINERPSKWTLPHQAHSAADEEVDKG